LVWRNETEVSRNRLARIREVGPTAYYEGVVKQRTRLLRHSTGTNDARTGGTADVLGQKKDGDCENGHEGIRQQSRREGVGIPMTAFFDGRAGPGMSRRQLAYRDESDGCFARRTVSREMSGVADVFCLFRRDPNSQNPCALTDGNGGWRRGGETGFGYACVLKEDQLAGMAGVVVKEMLPSVEVLPGLLLESAWRLEPGENPGGGTWRELVL
jgi:hypothetical protein